MVRQLHLHLPPKLLCEIIELKGCSYVLPIVPTCADRRGVTSQAAAPSEFRTVLIRPGITNAEAGTEQVSELAKLRSLGPLIGPYIISLRNNQRVQQLTREAWRRGWDSNPRWACTHGGFQDRCLKPLGHPSRSGEDRSGTKPSLRPPPRIRQLKRPASSGRNPPIARRDLTTNGTVQCRSGGRR